MRQEGTPDDAAEQYVLSPQAAVIRTAAGITVVRAAGASEVAVSRPQDQVTADLLGHFGRPRTLRSWLDRWPAGEQAKARQAFDHWSGRGVLRREADPPAAWHPESDVVAQSLLVELAGLRTRLTAAEALTRKEDRPGGPDHDSALVLQLCHFLLQEARQNLDSRLGKELAATVPTPPGGSPARLHIGCGDRYLDGWVNIDLVAPGADLNLDVRAGLPFSDGEAGAVYVAHLLEHLEYKEEALSFLADCRRVLRPGGIIRIAVPDIRSFATAYVRRDSAFFRRFERLWERAPSDTDLASYLHYAGAGDFPWVMDRHRFGYDEETLSALLSQAKFAGARRCTPGDSQITGPELDYSWADRENENGLPFTLIMEAEVSA
jgi:SAM-dependent methyltransferase